MVKKNLSQTIKGNEFLKIKESDKITLIILAIVVACFLLGYFLLVPKVNAYRTSKIAIENAQLQKDSLLQKEQLLQDLGKKIETEDAFIKTTNNTLPSTPQIPEILLTLDKIAMNNSLYIQTFTPAIEAGTQNAAGKIAANNGIKKITLQFNVSGKYPDIKQFIKDMEDNIRPINITTISISGGGGNPADKESKLGFSISAEVYYQ